MKTVHNKEMVAHLWANQSQTEARTQKGSMFFRDRTIYSYGTHFPIAKWVNHEVVLITTKTYSATTAQHIAQVRRAIRNTAQVIGVNNVLAETPQDHAENLSQIQIEIQTLQEKVLTARTRAEEYSNQIVERVRDYDEYVALFALSVPPLELPHDWKEQARQRIQAQKEATKAQREAEAKLKAERQGLVLQAMQAWIHHQEMPEGVGRYEFPKIQLRRKDETTGETSQGVEFPLEDAKRVWPLIQKVRASQIMWGGCYTIGSFTITRINAQGTVVAGCHTLTFEAMQDFAKRMGW